MLEYIFLSINFPRLSSVDLRKDPFSRAVCRFANLRLCLKQPTACKNSERKQSRHYFIILRLLQRKTSEQERMPLAKVPSEVRHFTHPST
jgi:hypothetical protein